MLEVRRLLAGYPGKPVLRDVSLTFPAGQITVILGPNGCGKSTLLKAMCGLLPASSGDVLLDGASLLALPPRMMAQKIAYLAQGREVPDITVERLILHGRFPYMGYLQRHYRKEDHAVAHAAMEAMGIAALAETPLRNLSGGQRQKAYLAMLLAQDTPVVLLDEPTTYLDISHQLQLMHQARALAQMEKTVVMVIHDLPLAFQTADRMVLMRDGAVAAVGTPEEIFTSGVTDRVFRIRLRRVLSQNGWHYYCEEEKP